MSKPKLQTTATLRPIAELAPYLNNPRTHSEDQIAKLAAMIDEVGFVGVVAVRDGVIAKGHGTLAAVKLLLAEGKAVYPAPGRALGAKPFPEGFLPVQDCTGWTDSQFQAFVMADNQLGLLSGWDDELLKLGMENIDPELFDIQIIGFSGAELDKLLAPPDSNEFTPELNPGTSHREVTEQDIDKAQSGLGGKFSNNPGRKTVEFLCPNCSEPFHMNADDVAVMMGGKDE